MRTRIHASCVARDDDAVLLLGPPGCGKSDLLLRLIDRGFTLVADDRVDIEGGRAHAPLGFEGLVEMRGLGILRMTWQASARLRLACELGDSLPRMPQPELHPLGIPRLCVNASAASAPLLVAHALGCLQGRLTLHVGALG